MEKKLLNDYLQLHIKHHFDLDLDMNEEYGFAENLVSKKTIIAPTFSEQVLSIPTVKMFLSSLIAEINNDKCTSEMIRERLENLRKARSEEMKKII